MGRLYASAMCNGTGTITIGGHASGASLMRLASMISGLVLPKRQKVRRRFLYSGARTASRVPVTTVSRRFRLTHGAPHTGGRCI